MIDVPVMATRKKTFKSILKKSDLSIKAIDFLDSLARKHPTAKVQSFLKFPSPWIDITDVDKVEKLITKHGSINHRSILKHEVIIDVDSENKNYGKIHLTALEKRWNLLGYKRSQWDSGGDGYHVQFDFKVLDAIANEDVSDIKKLLIEYLCTGFMFMFKTKEGRYLFSNKRKRGEELELCSHICLVNKSLIQIEYAPHRQGIVKLPFISSFGFTNNPVIEGSTPRIPKVVADIVVKNKEIRKKNRELNAWRSQNVSKGGLPPSIRFYLGEEIDGKRFTDYKDGYNRALFHLASFFIHTKSKDDLIDFLEAWVEKISVKYDLIAPGGRAFNRGYIRSVVFSSKGRVSTRARHQLLEELGCEDICESL